MPAHTAGALGDEEPLYASFIGPNWPSYYRPRFERFARGGGPIAWNWAAALVPFWLQYRKRGIGTLAAILFILATAWTGSITRWYLGETNIPLSIALVYAVFGLVQGAFGTRWLYRAARREVEALRGSGATAADERLVRQAPRGDARAYAVHALGVLILGGLGLGVSAFVVAGTGYWDRPSMASQRAALRALHEAQASFRERTGRYATTLDSLALGRRGTVSLALREASPEGYVAESADSIAPQRCALFAGVVAATPAGALAGEPRCYRVNRRGKWVPRDP